MFDIETTKSLVTNYFYKRLHSYRKKEFLEKFVLRWIQLLQEYSQYKYFITFEPKIPLLQLKPMAVGVLVVPFPNTKISLSFLPISVIPIYPFRVQLKHSRIACNEGLEILRLYLDLTDILIIGFFKVSNETSIISELKKRYPDACIYGRRSFNSFLNVCRLMTTQDMPSSECCPLSNVSNPSHNDTE